MMNILVFVRNLVLAGILAWLGLEFAPSDRDAPESAPEEGIFSAILG